MIWINRLMQMVILILLVWLLGKYHYTHNQWVSLFGSAAIFVFVILVHELGHAFALRSVGGRLKAFAVCGVRLTFDPLRISATPFSGGGDVGGYVAADYDHWKPSRGQLMFFFAGGIIANITLACLAIAAAVSAAAPPVLSDAQWSMLSEGAYWTLYEQWESYQCLPSAPMAQI